MLIIKHMSFIIFNNLVQPNIEVLVQANIEVLVWLHNFILDNHNSI